MIGLRVYQNHTELSSKANFRRSTVSSMPYREVFSQPLKALKAQMKNERHPSLVLTKDKAPPPLKVPLLKALVVLRRGWGWPVICNQLEGAWKVPTPLSGGSQAQQDGQASAISRNGEGRDAPEDSTYGVSFWGRHNARLYIAFAS